MKKFTAELSFKASRKIVYLWRQMKLGFVEISSSVFFLIYSKSSFIILTCWLNAAASSTSRKHDFNVLSNTLYTILSRGDFVLFAILSVTKKSFNYLNLALWICYGRKKKTIKIKSWSFHSATAVHDEDEQRFSKVNEIRVFYFFETRPSNQWTCSTFWLEMSSFFSD